MDYYPGLGAIILYTAIIMYVRYLMIVTNGLIATLLYAQIIIPVILPIVQIVNISIPNLAEIAIFEFGVRTILITTITLIIQNAKTIHLVIGV